MKIRIRIWEEPMHEKRYCLDCEFIGPMNVHGNCAKCGSQAVVLAESLGPYQQMRDESLRECERIFCLEQK